MKTDDADPAYIMIRTHGWVNDTWRIFIQMETGDERYYYLNYGMWVGGLTATTSGENGSSGNSKFSSPSAHRYTDKCKVSYDAYRVT
jgi:hypothetical protein